MINFGHGAWYSGITALLLMMGGSGLPQAVAAIGEPEPVTLAAPQVVVPGAAEAPAPVGLDTLAAAATDLDLTSGLPAAAPAPAPPVPVLPPVPGPLAGAGPAAPAVGPLAPCPAPCPVAPAPGSLVEGELTVPGQPGAGTTLPGPGVLTWSADFEAGDLRGFFDTPWNQVGSPAPRIVRTAGGTNALAFTIPAGGTRNELVPRIPDLNEGDDLYFGFSTLLGPGFPVDGSWQVLTQWKNDGTGSPPVSLAVENGRFHLDGGYGHPLGTRFAYQRDLAPAVPGQWHHWVFHIRFSAQPSAGFVEVWQDGRQLLTPFSPPGGTLYPGLYSYVKTGYYRDRSIGTSGTVVMDNWRIGTGYSVVALGGGAPVTGDPQVGGLAPAPGGAAAPAPPPAAPTPPPATPTPTPAPAPPPPPPSPPAPTTTPVGDARTATPTTTSSAPPTPPVTTTAGPGEPPPQPGG